MLVIDLGWTTEQYGVFIANALEGALLTRRR
jgi:hypothetical protein